MKFAQLFIGLLVGTALGGSVVAATSPTGGIGIGKPADAEAIKTVVRQVIMDEPKLIMESVQKFQMEQQKQQLAGASTALKEPGVREKVFNDPNAGSIGPADSTHVVVEFFDYNCPACKFMFKGIEELLAKDKTVRVVFHEYPIFGPVSEANSRIGVAVHRLNPDKYFAFHEKMMRHEGKTSEEIALKYVGELGIDVEKIKAEAASNEVAEVLRENQKLGEKLRIQGTPTLVIGDEVIPHAISFAEMEQRLNAKAKKPE